MTNGISGFASRAGVYSIGRQNLATYVITLASDLSGRRDIESSVRCTCWNEIIKRRCA